MTNSVSGDVARLDQARKEMDRVKQKKSTLAGELSGHRKRAETLELESVEKFGVKVEELPKEAERLEKEGEEALAEAERILGINDDGPEGAG